jgi:hypothetical protein
MNEIIAATTKNCIEYQRLSAAFAADAMHYRDRLAMLAARNAQQKSREYHDAAWDRLARLIGVE